MLQAEQQQLQGEQTAHCVCHSTDGWKNEVLVWIHSEVMMTKKVGVDANSTPAKTDHLSIYTCNIVHKRISSGKLFNAKLE